MDPVVRSLYRAWLKYETCIPYLVLDRYDLRSIRPYTNKEMIKDEMRIQDNLNEWLYGEKIKWGWIP
jgi:hypothetical protein